MGWTKEKRYKVQRPYLPGGSKDPIKIVKVRTPKIKHKKKKFNPKKVSKRVDRAVFGTGKKKHPSYEYKNRKKKKKKKYRQSTEQKYTYVEYEAPDWDNATGMRRF